MFDLALRLNKTVFELEQMSTGEFTEWIAYFKLLESEKEDVEMREKAKNDIEAFRDNLVKGRLLSD